MSRLANQIKFTLSDLFLRRTWQESSRMQVYKGSHRKGNANFVGLVGEKLAIAWLRKNGFDPCAVNEIEHDLRVGTLRIEVKTKDRTVDGCSESCPCDYPFRCFSSLRLLQIQGMNQTRLW